MLGFDGLYASDSTCLVACTLAGFVWPVAVWERPEKALSDWKVPRQEVDDAVAQAMERLAVVELACDPYGWSAELDRWAEMYGEVVLEFPTASRQRMVPACSLHQASALDSTPHARTPAWRTSGQ